VKEERAKRKLTAILSADVKGYSRLMGDDEEATVRTITAFREIMTSLIQGGNGRVVDAKGDNVLAEFPSVVDAVHCAVRVQKELKEKNAALVESRRMEFRIGINLGDVIEEEDTIYGDGVNIAARLEGLAEGGGICISGKVYEEVKNKLALGYEHLGEQIVKNIKEPVRAYRVLMQPEHAGKVVREKRPGNRQRRWGMLAVAVVLVAAAGVLAIRNSNLHLPSFEPASVERMAFPLPAKPSIAVLPFTNTSGDPKDDYLADGFTENIISSLSKNSEMFVISRNSSFTYRGAPAKVQKVSEELGVRYVLEGSVQKSADRVRVPVQLVDATTGHQLWSERYDRDMRDFFAVQDEITGKIAAALQVELTHGERTRSYVTTPNLVAWECTVKGNGFFVRFTKEDNAKARELFRRATELDPKYAFAWALLAWSHFIDAWFEFSESPAGSYDEAVELAQRALALDNTIPDTHSLLGFIHLIQRQHEQALAEGSRALALSPNDGTSLMLLAQTLCYAGRIKEAIPLARKAVRLSPCVPAWYIAVLGLCYYSAEMQEESLEAYNQLLKRSQNGETPPWWAHVGLTSVYMKLGREREARAHAAEVLKIEPDFSLEWIGKLMPFKDPARLEHHLEALRKAGLK
jgi:adenylate cyclase